MTKPILYVSAFLLLAFSVEAAERPKSKPQAPKQPDARAAQAAPVTPASPAVEPSRAQGRLVVTLTDVANHSLDGRVALHAKTGKPAEVTVTRGHGEGEVPAGEYRAFIYALEEGIPLMVAARPVTVEAGKTATLSYSQLEGAAGDRRARDFDQDFDLALDRAEIEAGTNPADPMDVPGQARLDFPDPVKGTEKRWYRGELHAQSRYGRGTESVRELVKRAEQLGLDFLAIADPNTLAAAQDPEFKSDSVVLIPAMAWGSEERGYALVYGPRTFPTPPSSHTEAQAVTRMLQAPWIVQAQGAVVTAAHPCFPGLGWKWYVPGINGVETWCRDWGRVPPVDLKSLPEDLRTRTREGLLIYSIAAAVEQRGLCANGQATLFWDHELVEGRRLAAIGGSMTGSPNVPMAQPITYVFAQEKSVKGILDGIRKGHTYVSSGVDGPRIDFEADAMRDGKIDVGMGGAVPIGLTVDLLVRVFNAAGKRLEILYNGLPIYSRVIEASAKGDGVGVRVPQKPEAHSVYRVCVVEPAGPDTRFGPTKVLAMTSPIYAEGILVLPTGMKAEDLRFQVQGKEAARNPYVTPVYAEKVAGPDGKGEFLHIEKGPQERPLLPLGGEPLPNPGDEGVINIKTREFSLEPPASR